MAVGANADDVWHFEPKWCNGMSRKQLGHFDTDCTKMFGWEAASAHYLVTVWHSDERTWCEDLAAMHAFCAHKQDCCTTRPVYAASFATDWKRAQHAERLLRYRGIRQHPGKVTERVGAP